jgi:hypothetical protein
VQEVIHDIVVKIIIKESDKNILSGFIIEYGFGGSYCKGIKIPM